VRELPGGEAFRAQMNMLDNSAAQVLAVETFLDELHEKADRIPATGQATEISGRDNTMETAI
jgi:tRNA-dihydrouridine synthase B